MKALCRSLVFAALALLVATARGAVETYAIDPAASTVGFSIRNFVARVPGKFTKFSGAIRLDRADPAKNSVEAAIDVASVDTGNAKRDEHLRSADFFDAAKSPQMKFASTAWKKTGENTYDVTGKLTLNGVTKEIVLKVITTETAVAGSADRTHWKATTTLDRRDFAFKYSGSLGFALGDEVAIALSIEARKS